ncbi:MAG: hypothetical protein WC542_02945 [Paludibacter sp.]
MKKSVIERIKQDLKESKINWKVALFFIPLAFLTYLFHEFGHWTVGEVFGNSMTYSLNNAAPRNGYFINDSQALWSAMGGPAFTIIQALLFLFVTQKTKSIYSYSIVFFAAFTRFFSLLFGGLSLQDEAKISSMLNIHQYLVPLIVLLLLFLIVARSSRIMNLSLKAVGYFIVLSTLANLLVIGVSKLIE